MDRRAHLARAHRLAPAHRAATPEDVADSLVALHSTDPASVHLAILARTADAGAPVADVDRALHDDRTLVRIMGMRRTIWAVPADLVPVVAGACGRAIADVERRNLVRALEEQGIVDDGARFVAELQRDTLAALADRGEALTAELTKDVPALKGTVRYGGDCKWATDIGLSTRIVLLLSMEGRILRRRPTGDWTSTRHRYAVAPDADEPMTTADAQAELARRWLRAFGPASTDPVADLKWWAGWTVAATKRALASAGPIDAEAADGDPGPWAALVPSLDPTTMGWKDRSWYLPEHVGATLFDRTGNAGPAIWWNGQVVGGWAHRASGEVATRLLVDIGVDGVAAVDTEAERVRTWLAASGTIVKPRFAGPLHKELAT